MKLQLLLLPLSALALLAGGCSSPYRTQPPAPIERSGVPVERPQAQTPAPAAAGEPTISAYIPPAEPRTARPMPAKAVQVLQRRAADQRRGGDLDGAVASLERALRIEPRNAELWNQLAHLREGQARHAMAEELAGKSNSLAGLYDRDLKRDNWEIIVRSRRAQGLGAAAREAEREAARYE